MKEIKPLGSVILILSFVDDNENPPTSVGGVCQDDIKHEFDSLFKDAQKILKKHKDTPEKISKTEFLLDDLWDKEPKNIDIINMITRWDPVSSIEWESGFEELEGFTYEGLMEICKYKNGE